MFRLVLGALSALVLSLPAAAQVPPYPDGFRTQEIQANGTTLHVRVGGQGRRFCCCTATARPATCGRSSRRTSSATIPWSCRTCGAWGFPSRPDGGYDKKTQGQDVAGLLDALTIEQGRPRHARHRQHGRLRLRRAAPGPGDAVCSDRCAAAGDRSVGRNPQEPAAVAFPVWRSRHGAPRRRPRANLSRSLLERVLRQRPADSAKPRASTMPNCTRCRAPCTLDSPSLPRSIRMPSTTSFRRCGGQAGDAGAGGRRREIVRPDDGDGDAVAASNVTEDIVPDSGHWIMEENPTATGAMVRSFLSSK